VVTGAVGATARGAAAAPAAVPHRWQKWAPGVKGAPQELQLTPSMAAPQSGQNRPLEGVPQLGQGVVEVDMGNEDTGSTTAVVTDRGHTGFPLAGD
jgi:hypothetical protein